MKKTSLVRRNKTKSKTEKVKIYKDPTNYFIMMKVSGFGYWRLFDKDMNVITEIYGIVDLVQRLFIETDENQNPNGKVYNLNYLGGWEPVSKKRDVFKI